MTGLGIDAGGSSTHWLLLDSSARQLATGREAGITGHLFTAAGELSSEGGTYLERLDAILQAARAVGSPDAVVLGAAGLSAGSAAAQQLASLIHDRLGLPPERIRVVHDLQIAYLASFMPGAGVLVYGGTGSIAYHLDRDGSELRVGGHGYLIDDAGGGYAIGRAALAQVLRWHDELGRPAGTPLAQQVYAQLGASGWPEIREEIYRGGRSRVAALVPAVGVAASEGDEAALRILQQAGVELARLGRVILQRLEQQLPVTLAGGVRHLGAPLLDAFQAGLPGSKVQISEVEPVEGAARLALQLAETS